MDQITHEVRMANWISIVDECQSRPNGQTAKQWLAENNISSKQYYYWLRKIRATAGKQAITPSLPKETEKLPSVSFAEIPVKELQVSSEESPAVIIRTKKSTIEISSALPENLMVKLVKAVSHAL